MKSVRSAEFGLRNCFLLELLAYWEMMSAGGSSGLPSSAPAPILSKMSFAFESI